MDINDIAFAVFLYYSLFVVDLYVFGDKSVDFIITYVGIPKVNVVRVKYIRQIMLIQYRVKSCRNAGKIHREVLFVRYLFKPIHYIFYNIRFLIIKILFDLLDVQFFLIPADFLSDQVDGSIQKLPFPFFLFEIGEEIFQQIRSDEDDSFYILVQ